MFGNVTKLIFKDKKNQVEVRKARNCNIQKMTTSNALRENTALR